MLHDNNGPLWQRSDPQASTLDEEYNRRWLHFENLTLEYQDMIFELFFTYLSEHQCHWTANK